MRVLVMSDLHDITYDEIDLNLVDRKDFYDMIVLLGDIDINTLKYIKYTISQNGLDKQIIGVEGNKDSIGDLQSVGIKNIHMKFKTINNIKFGGFSGATDSGDSKKHPIFSQAEAYELLDGFKRCDILITHNSPKGIHDDHNITHSGFDAINEYIKDKQPLMCIHGHQHINSISLLDNTYIVCVYGISIIDIEELTVTTLY